MREKPSDVIEAGRVGGGPGDNAGAARVRCPHCGDHLALIFADGEDWSSCGLALPAFEHVSVSHPRRIPVWEEMAWVKDQFWKEEETVIQLHVPRAAHVNIHNTTLHLWRPLGVEIPLPPRECV